SSTAITDARFWLYSRSDCRAWEATRSRPPTPSVVEVRGHGTEFPLSGQRTIVWKETCPDAPGAMMPGSVQRSSVDPTRLTAVEKLVPLGPRELPLTYSNRGSRLSAMATERLGVLPVVR